MKMIPLAPKSNKLPFEGYGFSWTTFEDFFCDFLAAGPTLLDASGNGRKVVRARPYGRKGDKQEGIDIIAEMEGGEKWVFQCKHCKQWGPSDTKKAIEACTFEADRKFLLVTRDVSEQSFDIIKKLPDWELWDARKITREFVSRLPGDEASRLLYVHFGAGWPEHFFDMPGRNPITGAEAHFNKYLEAGRVFHHGLEMVGRQKYLALLDKFQEAKRKRVFFLKGRGGIGKSRLLLEWSRVFNRRHPGATVRFISDSPASAADYSRSLDLTSGPLVLVLDDAHRLPEVRQSLLPVIEERKDVKLLLSLRPGPTALVRGELAEAGYDPTQIEEAEEILPLSEKENLALVEMALGKELAGSPMRHQFASLSRDSPLIAVLAVELFKSGDLSETDIQDTEAFKDIVLQKGFERDVKPVVEAFPQMPVRDLLSLLSLISPVNVDKGFFQDVAKFLGERTRPSLISRMIEFLRDSGLLIESEAGIRIVPDLLSDYLAFDACYDSRGRNRSFTADVLDCFSPKRFPSMLLNLAEAEWRAFQKNRKADSVVKPLWQWFADRFKKSSFFNRRAQLREWANVAHFQPERTLLLAKMAMEMRDAPAMIPDEELAELWEDLYDSQDYVLHSIPSILKPLAVAHPDYTGRCLDILRELENKDLPAIGPGHSDGVTPVLSMSEIARYELWKSLAVNEAVLDWVEGNLDVLPPWLTGEILKPFFKTSFDEKWSSGLTFHIRTHLVSIKNTSHLRERALSICRELERRKSVSHVLSAVAVLGEAIAGVDPMYRGRVPASHEKAWLKERLKALAQLEELVKGNEKAVVHFKVRQSLLNHLRFASTEAFKLEARKLLDKLPVSLELDILRASLSYASDEFDRPVNAKDYAGAIDRRWGAFLNSVHLRLRQAAPRASEFVDYLVNLDRDLTELGFHPNFRPLLSRLSEDKPGFALELSCDVIVRRQGGLGKVLDSLVLQSTKKDREERMAICRKAMCSGNEDLMRGAVSCFAWWRKNEPPLPDDAWELLFDSAPRAGCELVGTLIHFLSVNDVNSGRRDWDLVGKLPRFDLDWHGDRLAVVLRNLLRYSGFFPDEEQVSRVLDKLVTVGIRWHRYGPLLKTLAEKDPAQVFLFLRARTIHRNQSDIRFSAIPVDLHDLSLTDALKSSEVAAVVEELENRAVFGPPLDLHESRLLQCVLFHADASHFERATRLVGKVETKDQLERVVQFYTATVDWPLILHCPDFAKGILGKARALGEEVFKVALAAIGNLQIVRGASHKGIGSDWVKSVEELERMAHKHAGDPDLGPLYARAVTAEREWIKRSRFNMPTQKPTP